MVIVRDESKLGLDKFDGSLSSRDHVHGILPEADSATKGNDAP